MPSEGPQCLELEPGVADYVKHSICDAEGKRGNTWCEEKWTQLLQVLASPPAYSTLRINTLLAEGTVIREQLCSALEKQYKEKNQTVSSVHTHPLLDDVLVVEHQGPMLHVERLSREVVVGLACGMAVLRGAHVFAMGVMGSPIGLKAGDTVSVYADIEGKCLRGLIKPFEGSKLYVGNGIAQMDRRHLFCNEGKISGVAVLMTQPLYVAPSLSDVLPELVFPQNLPSVVCSRVLDPRAGDTVLDMCAAPGGKTTHIACLMKRKGRLVAFDKSTKKIEKVLNNASIWQLRDRIEAYAQDSTRVAVSEDADVEGPPPYPPEVFDRILLDAPCSALGQRPSVRNKMSLAEVRSYPALQRSLFKKAVQLVKTGGTIVYSTCTVTLEENEEMVNWALTTFPCLRLVKQVPYVGSPGWPGTALSKENLLMLQRFDPSVMEHSDVNTDTIGFFIAKFEKMARPEVAASGDVT